LLIWLDFLTPKQVFFLGELGRRLEAKGHNVFRTTRRFREVDTLIELKNINALFVGKYGGATLEGKLSASAQRIERLSYIISRLKPDISISFSSPDAARTAFGLRIPHYTINDSPHSSFVARLTIPLSKKLFSPSIISKDVWLQLGATRDQLIQYHALDPVAWLKTFTPNPEILNELNLDPSRPIIVLRVEESFASYLLGYAHLEEPTILPIINKLLDEHGDTLQIVALPRYEEQIPIIKAAYNNSIIIPEKTIDGPSLLFFTSIFIGAGGTMTAESALMGKPTLSCYPREPTIVEKYLIDTKLIHRATNPEKVCKILNQILNNYEVVSIKQQKLASAVLSSMEDPLDIIIDTIETDSLAKQALS
jgi:predicted glycosyltransferase